MSYAIDLVVDEFPFQFGQMGFMSGGLGIFVNFDDPKIKKAIETGDENFYQAIKTVFSQSDEIDALYEIANFERYALQGHGWRALLDNYGFPSQQKFKNQAELVLASKRANEEQRRIARTIIDVLNGTYKFPPPPEKTPEEKARAAFEKKRDKLKLKLTIERGYKCDPCGETKENSLCLVRRDDSVHDYSLENLVLRCRSCMNKMKKNKR